MIHSENFNLLYSFEDHPSTAWCERQNCDSALHVEYYYITHFVTIIMFHVMLFL